MFREFFDIAQSIENQYIKKAKQQKRLIIGYTCSYFPEEILHSLNIIPYRIKGIGVSSLSVADSAFGPFICSHPKCLLQNFADNKYSFLDGIIVTPGCDSMRRIDECLRKSALNLNMDFVPEFFFHYAVPHKVVDYSIKWLVDELNRFIECITDHFDIQFSMDKLRDSIKFFNKLRDKLSRLNVMRTLDVPKISGSELIAIYVAGLSMPREIFFEKIDNILKSEINQEYENRLRIMLIGSANDDIKLLNIIENNGAIVVSDTLCYGPRIKKKLIDENEDPIYALAQGYLENSHCPRMYGGYKQRLQKIINAIRELNIHGVILQNIRFCDLHGAENGLIQRDLEKIKVPCLKIEREYGPMADYERLNIRIEAFMEMLRSRNLGSRDKHFAYA